MSDWSRLFQNEEFLEKTRMGMLNPEMGPLIARWMGLKGGEHILDVGCGTGAFSFYLSQQVPGLKVVGLDLEEAFIRYANNKAQTMGLPCSFLVGDALSLPFEEGAFDLVVSHTFLTSLPDYLGGIKEMKRVCKRGGILAVVTPMTIKNVGFDPGNYPASWTWKKRYDQLNSLVWQMYQKVAPYQNFSSGISPTKVPAVLAQCGLREIRVYPLGVFFSLSNAALTPEEKKRYIHLDYVSETKRLDAVYEEEAGKACMKKEEVEEFKALLALRRDTLLDHLEDNSIWDWFGNMNLLTIGKVE